MSLYRCAGCGSKNVSVDTQSGGIKYNYVKGAVGTVLLGTGGAAAGITNKEQQVYKCSDCGVTLTYPMPEDIKVLVDLGVDYVEQRDRLSLQGISVPWSFLTSKYKNIESGMVDAEIARKKAHGIEVLKMFGSATEEEFMNATTYILQFYARTDDKFYEIKPDFYYSEWNLPSLADYLKFLSSLDLFFHKYFRFRSYEVAPEGLEKLVLKRFLSTYVFIHYCNATRKHCLYKYGLENSENFERFVFSKPFISELVIYYFTYIDKADYYVKFIKNKQTCQFCSDLFTSVLDRCCGLFDIEGFILPLFQIKNGTLYYHNKSFVRQSNYIEIDELRNEYFSIYPDKKKEYKKKISDNETRKKEITQKINEQKEQLEKLEQIVKDEKKKVTNNQALIANLRKKIFGKKKAAEEIQELESAIANSNSIIETNMNELNSLKKTKYEKPEDDKIFYSRLYAEYDYFLIWNQIDETKE